MATIASSVTAASPALSNKCHPYLFGPLVDFACLGGASLLILPILIWLLPVSEYRNSVAEMTLLVANIINHPHFAHSYQLFYSDFRTKAFGSAFAPRLRFRYWIAGIVVPIALCGYFALALLRGNDRWLGISVNLMLLLVGWHYAKQGYGILVMDSARKRRFLHERDKKILLYNAYACWILSWLLANTTASNNKYWGISYYAIPVPNAATWLMIFIVTITSLFTVKILLNHLCRGGTTPHPLNGVLAYIASLYLWLLYREPVLLLIAPIFHSLQYLIVVWRFQLNKELKYLTSLPSIRSRSIETCQGASQRMTLFVLTGIVLGILGFWFLPRWTRDTFPLMSQRFGEGVFFLVFWVFINIHHYCLDNMIWRKENPETKRYLFS